ncbi:MAG: hypothetical protein H6807_09805 [Planctomycetes bacterium]|nr:hypothetical protein [Planctomycetota bacterium]
MNSSGTKQIWRRGAFASMCLSALATIVIVSCSHKELDPWTDHRSPPKNVLVTDEGRIDLDAQTATQAATRSQGCIKCHPGVGDPHGENLTSISCVDCHGGNGLAETIEEGHPKPDHPENFPSSANPERSYLNFLKENWDWVRFVNPGDLRVADVTCSPCHDDEVLNVKKSVMTTAAHFWGVAGYANGIVSAKRSIFGESYSPQGRSQIAFTLIRTPNGGWRKPTDDEVKEHSISPLVAPLPHWEITQTGNIYRVFEQGSRLGGPALGFNGAPTPLIGVPDKLEDPGRPNNRLSDRGLGTLNRVDLPILNVQKTRLNDPHLSFMGTNDQPGDYRSSGCTACHVVYANDRDPFHSGPYAKFGNMGKTRPDNPDVSIKKDESGHPLSHQFTTAIPSSNCMVCHMHQPNSFVNSYYGFTMWTYETDGADFWPKKQKELSHEEYVEGLMKNPEGAAVRGKWIDNEFLKDSAPNVNPRAKHTQFADYHGHGWMFRGVFKTDRKGNLLDEKGQVVPYDDPMKFQGSVPIEGDSNPYNAKAPDHARRAVHLKDIHAERGMHCVDCHFRNDAHGDGNIYHEYQAQVEIRCDDCHGSATDFATLEPSGPSSQAPGHQKINLGDLRTAYGKPVMEWQGRDLWQNSMVTEGLRWRVPQVKDSVTPGNEHYSKKAAYYKTIQKDNRSWGSVPSDHSMLAHQPDRMECYACHTSWVTACFGCHLPQKANMKTPMRHFEQNELRNFASYNPQVVRDAEFMLGVAGDVKNNAFAPVRSSSAVLISSEDAQRRRIYGQIPTIAANGMSSQLFNTHFPHTVRTTETRQCGDCHVSENDDNNAWLAQTYLLGTQQVGFMGYNCWIGTGEGGVEAVRVTEWEEPQAVIGSPLQAMAWPDHYAEHVAAGGVLKKAEHHGGTDTRSVELRGEYLYTAQGPGGFRVYDVAQVGNKDFSEKIVTSPVSPLGQDTQVDLPWATAVALPFNNNISMSRLYRPENREQRYEYDGQAQNMHEVYRYAFVSDRVEGLAVIDIDKLTDGNPRNNFIEKVASFNPGGVLNGAEHLEIAGTTVYLCCDSGLVAVSVEDPRAPRLIKVLPWPKGLKPRFVDVQFRYAFVCDQEGVKVVDITLPEQMHPVAKVEIADARSIYVAKTYGYVGGGAEGLVVVDLEKPTQPKIQQVWNADGAIDDLYQVKVAMTYDSVYGYLADGRNGLRVVQLVGAGDGPRSPYGFSPPPLPVLVATYPTGEPCVAVGKALDRDRAVDESGNQVTLFGRIGGRPMNAQEMRRLYLKNGQVYRVRNDPPDDAGMSRAGGASAELPEKGN